MTGLSSIDSEQNITEVGAVVNSYNIAARAVLKKAGFVHQAKFDLLQDLYINRLIA